MQQIILMMHFSIRFVTVIFLALLFSCKQDDNPEPDPTNDADAILIPAGKADTLLYFKSSFDEKMIPVKIAFPNIAASVPAIVVMHGSGGGWNGELDTNGDGIPDLTNVGTLSSQNRQWKELLTSNGYVAAFPESFYARGTVEAQGEWDELPLKLKINAQGPRARDAIQTLELLLKLRKPDGTPWVRKEDVGITGFSDGATTVYCAVYNHPASTPDSHQWLYDKTVPVPAPEKTTDHPRFAAAVAKYGGASHHSYYGTLSDCSKNVYKPYCPLRVELGEEDGLTADNVKLFNCMTGKGVNNIEYYVYPNADHGFDTKDAVNGPLSRQHTLEFFNQHLKD